MQRGCCCPELSTLNHDRRETLMILIDERVEKVEDDGSDQEAFSSASSIKRLKFAKGCAPER